MNGPRRLLDVLGMTLPVILDGQEIIGGGGVSRIDEVGRLIVVGPVRHPGIISTLAVAEVLKVSKLISRGNHGVVGDCAGSHSILTPSIVDVCIGGEGEGEGVRLVAHEATTPVLRSGNESDAGRRTGSSGILSNLGIAGENLEHGNLKTKGRDGLGNSVSEFLVERRSSFAGGNLHPGNYGNKVTRVVINNAPDGNVEFNALTFKGVDGNAVVESDHMLDELVIHFGSSLLGHILYIAYRNGVGPGEDTVAILVHEVQSLEGVSAYSGTSRLSVGENCNGTGIGSLDSSNTGLVIFSHVQVTGLVGIVIRHSRYSFY